MLCSSSNQRQNLQSRPTYHHQSFQLNVKSAADQKSYVESLFLDTLDQVLTKSNRKCTFLGATKHLYNWLCPSVGWSVGYAFVRRSTRRTLLAYLALFIFGLIGQFDKIWFLWIMCIWWFLPLKDSTLSFYHIGWKMPNYRCFSLIGWQASWEVGRFSQGYNLNLFHLSCICRVFLYSSFNHIGKKIPELSTFSTLKLIGWVGQLGWSDCKTQIGCIAPFPYATLNMQRHKKVMHLRLEIKMSRIWHIFWLYLYLMQMGEKKKH